MPSSGLLLGFAAPVLLAMASASAAAQTSPSTQTPYDGVWQVVWRCESNVVTGAAPMTELFQVQLNDNRFSRTNQGTGPEPWTQTWEGRVQGQNLTVVVDGSHPSGRRWQLRQSGQFQNPTTVNLSGGLFGVGNDTRQFRVCSAQMTMMDPAPRSLAGLERSRAQQEGERQRQAEQQRVAEEQRRRQAEQQRVTEEQRRRQQQEREAAERRAAEELGTRLTAAERAAQEQRQLVLAEERRIEQIAVERAAEERRLQEITAELEARERRLQQLTAQQSAPVPQQTQRRNQGEQPSVAADQREAAQRAAEEQRQREAAQRAAEEQRQREAAQRAADEQRQREAAQRAAEEQRQREAAQRAAASPGTGNQPPPPQHTSSPPVLINNVAFTQLGTSFDCSRTRQDIPSLACNDPELRAADVRQMHAYYTLRHAAPDRQQDLRNQFVSRIQALVRECSAADASVAGRQKACVMRGLDDMRSSWLRELQQIGNAAALEEARLEINQVLAVQTALQTQGLLPNNSPVDGVYGNRTREALRQFQSARGLTASGFANGATTQALLQGRVAATAQAPASQQPAAREEREAAQRADQRAAQLELERAVEAHRARMAEGQRQSETVQPTSGENRRNEPASASTQRMHEPQSQDQQIVANGGRNAITSCNNQTTRECVCAESATLARSAYNQAWVNALTVGRSVQRMSTAGCIGISIDLARELESASSSNPFIMAPYYLSIRSIAESLVHRGGIDEATMLLRPFLGKSVTEDRLIFLPLVESLANSGQERAALTFARDIRHLPTRAEALSQVAFSQNSHQIFMEALSLVRNVEGDQTAPQEYLRAAARILSDMGAKTRDISFFQRAIAVAQNIDFAPIKVTALMHIASNQAKSSFFSDAANTIRRFGNDQADSKRATSDLIFYMYSSGDTSGARNQISLIAAQEDRDRVLLRLINNIPYAAEQAMALSNEISNVSIRTRALANIASSRRNIDALRRAEVMFQSLQGARDFETLEAMVVARAQLGNHSSAIATARSDNSEPATLLAAITRTLPPAEEASDHQRQRRLVSQRLASEQSQREAQERARQREAQERARQQSTQPRSPIADAQCRTVEQVLLSQTLQLRRQGVPIEIAHRTFETFMRSSMDLWRWSIVSVNELYRDPNHIENLIRSGRWRELCVQAVSGF
jgi:uncharacterized protein